MYQLKCPECMSGNLNIDAELFINDEKEMEIEKLNTENISCSKCGLVMNNDEDDLIKEKI